MRRRTAILIALICLLLCQFPAYAERSEWQAGSRHINAGGYQLDVQCMGQGWPTVVMDAADYLDIWRFVEEKIVGFTRVCAFDREGLGLSERGPGKLTVARLAHDLGRVLADPWVGSAILLAGSDLGADDVLRYMEHRRDAVRGLVLVDPIPAALIPAAAVFPYPDVATRSSRAEMRTLPRLQHIPVITVWHHYSGLLPPDREQQWHHLRSSLFSVTQSQINVLALYGTYTRIVEEQPWLVAEALLLEVRAIRTGQKLAPCGFELEVEGGRCLTRSTRKL